jgi:hypothetical protein
MAGCITVVLKLFWFAAQKITKICPRHNTFINLIFVRITQGCGWHYRYQFCLNLNVDFIDTYMITAYYGSLINSLRVQKSEKLDITFVELKFFWHIFNILTAQYCAAAHSLRITGVLGKSYIIWIRVNSWVKVQDQPEVPIPEVAIKILPSIKSTANLLKLR